MTLLILIFSSTFAFCFIFLIFASISQQPQSPKEQPKKGDQKGDDNKKQGGKHLYELTFCQDLEPRISTVILKQT